MFFFHDGLLCRSVFFPLISPNRPNEGDSEALPKSCLGFSTPRLGFANVYYVVANLPISRVSLSHSNRFSRGHTKLMPVCSHFPPLATTLLFSTIIARGNMAFWSSWRQFRFRSKSSRQSMCSMDTAKNWGWCYLTKTRMTSIWMPSSRLWILKFKNFARVKFNMIIDRTKSNILIFGICGKTTLSRSIISPSRCRKLDSFRGTWIDHPKWEFS